jgi:hypothetical protein
MENLKIWRLVEVGKYCSFIPHDLDYFLHRFNCSLLGIKWELPPAKIYGRSFPLGAFVSCMHKAPVVSARSKSLIEKLACHDVEFLEFHSMKKKPFFVMNVLRSEDVLDFERSSFSPIKERYYFKESQINNLPPIFKCAGFYSQIFVTRPFGEMIVANRLRGAALADPAAEALPIMVSGKSLNCFPGLEG